MPSPSELLDGAVMPGAERSFLPRDVDLYDKLCSTFGMCEYEDAMCEILRYLQDSSREPAGGMFGGQRIYEAGEGWEKKFGMSDLPNIPAVIFAMLCRSWILPCGIPKGWFQLDPAAVQRLRERYEQRRRVIVGVDFAAGVDATVVTVVEPNGKHHILPSHRVVIADSAVLNSGAVRLLTRTSPEATVQVLVAHSDNLRALCELPASRDLNMLGGYTLTYSRWGSDWFIIPTALELVTPPTSDHE